MCQERDRTKNAEAPSEQSGTAGSSAASRDVYLPDCCRPMIDRMMKTFAEPSTGSEEESPGGESQPRTGASCASMMKRMMDICCGSSAEENAASDQNKHPSSC